MKIQPCKIERPGEDVVGRKVLPCEGKYAEYAHGILLEKEQRQPDRTWIWKVVKFGLLLSPIWVATLVAIIGIATRSEAERALDRLREQMSGTAEGDRMHGVRTGPV